jgi:hypothetical protein
VRLPTVLQTEDSRLNAAQTQPLISEREIRTAFWLVAIIFGFLQAWNNRHVMNSDGICYLDLANAYLRGGWKMLINGHWSPFYPWLLALAKKSLHPSGYWEFTIVHLVNFTTYLGAAAAFEVMLGEFIASRERFTGSDDSSPLPLWSLKIISYLIFLWLSLTLITLERKSPDMLMSIFVYLAIALLLRTTRREQSWTDFAALGSVLGFGYLAKAPFFPLAFVFFAIALIASGNIRKAIPRTFVAFLLFGLISAPLVMGLSRMKGRLTFGDSGKLNYLVMINGAGPGWYMQNVGSGGGKFIHPPQKLFDSPPVYGFSGMGGTLPAWYDPSYWIEGAQPRFDPRRQVSSFLKNCGVYFDLLFAHEAAVLAVFLTLLWLGRRGAGGRLAQHWPVLLLAVAALGMYAVVLVQERYVAVFLIVLWTSMFFTLRFPSPVDTEKLSRGATFAILVTLGTPLLLSATQDFDMGILHRQKHVQWEIAKDLRTLGVRPGDQVGRIGGLYRVEWAYLLHTRVIAEIPRPQAENFWSAGSNVQAQVMAAFAKAGVSAVIAEQIPPWEVFTPAPGWERIGNSDFYVFLVAENAAH